MSSLLAFFTASAVVWIISICDFIAALITGALGGWAIWTYIDYVQNIVPFQTTLDAANNTPFVFDSRVLSDFHLGIILILLSLATIVLGVFAIRTKNIWLIIAEIILLIVFIAESNSLIYHFIGLNKLF